MLLKGDCIEVMKAMKPNSVDAIVTDPPYGLEFMGKEWDKLWDKRDGKLTDLGIQKQGDPFIGKNLSQYKAGLEMQLWHTQWLTEAYRVLKPGASMLVMGGTRTSHRLACAIEDTGFIIKDTLMFMYGSGFPKAQDLGKMIDKRARRDFVQAAMRLGIKPKSNASWRDWTIGEHAPSNKYWEEFKKAIPKEDWQRIEREVIGNSPYYCEGRKSHNWCITPQPKEVTAPTTDLAKHWDGFKVGGIKPAYEPIIWAVKPPEGSYVDNVLKWGVGAVNVDECRVGIEPHVVHGKEAGKFQPTGGATIKDYHEVKGRFPANIILSHHPECVQVGVKKIKSESGSPHVKTNCGNAWYKVKVDKNAQPWRDPDGLEIVESWDCVENCPVRLLDEQSGNLPNNYRQNKGIGKNNCAYFGNAKSERGGIPYNDNGGASRFFYCAKASRAERNQGLDSLAIIDIIRVWKESNTIREEKLAKLQVDMATLHARAIDGFGIKNKSVLGWSMSWFGKNTLEKYQRDIGFTIKTTTNSITISQILKYLTSLLTKEYTADVKLLKGNGGNPAENADDSNQLIISISESMASRLGVKNVASETQLKISVREGQNIHPTCKPTKLFEYLIKLVTRQDQIILDPFIGSGTTAIAAHNVGRKCIGIEKEEEYLEIAKRRATHWRSRPKQLEMTGG